MEISTFWSLSYWNLYFLYTFLLKSLLSRHFPIEISTVWSLFYWNLCFLFTFRLKFLPSVTFWSLSFWNPYLFITFRGNLHWHSLITQHHHRQPSTTWKPPLQCVWPPAITYPNSTTPAWKPTMAFPNNTAPPSATQHHLEPTVTMRLTTCDEIPH